MPLSARQVQHRRATIIEAQLGRYQTRLILSVLILLSISPFAFVDALWLVFAAVFGLEAVMRAYVLFYGRRSEGPRARLTETGMLGLDLLAWLSFLPLAEATGLRYLRLVRFARLGLLVRYWGSTFRTVWHLLRREERSRQLKLLFVSVVGLTFVSGSILHEMARSADPEELGIEGPVRFVDLLWWSLRQMNDPGNLVSDVHNLGIVLLSTCMTVSGIVLFSFLVGIGTSVVEDLMEASREQPMGYRDHSVLVNAGPHVGYLLDEVEVHFQKQLVRPRWMVLGRESNNPEIETAPRYGRIHYRSGSPYHADDLDKVDAAAAERIVVLAERERSEPDFDTASAVLSIRQVNPDALIYAEVLELKHAAAVLAAGAGRTVVVPTERLLATVLANLVVRPQLEGLVETLLRAHGAEFYVARPGGADARRRLATWIRTTPAPERMAWAYRQHGCIPIGWDIRRANARDSDDQDYLFGAELPDDHGDQLRGVIGIASNSKQLAEVVEEAPSTHLESPPDEPDLLRGLTLRPDLPSSSPQSLLLCRFLPRTPLLIEHLMRFKPGSTVYVMLATEARCQDATRELLEYGESLELYGDRTRYDTGTQGRFAPHPDGGFRYRLPARDEDDGGGHVHLIVADWSSRQELLMPRECGFDFFAIDQMVVQARPSLRGDPDSRTAMALLKLANLSRHPNFRDRFNPNLRLVVEIVDPLKSELLERRFRAGADQPFPVAVVTTEWLRHLLVFQSTIVPRFGRLLGTLLSAPHSPLARLAVDGLLPNQQRTVTFGELLCSVQRSHGMTAVGVELKTADGGTELVILPDRQDVGAAIPLSRLAAVYGVRALAANS